MRVLLADDDRTSRKLIESYLERWRYQVTVVEDGLSAWEILQRSDAPRLAILDWMMPGMEGAEVCRRVRAEVKEPYIYIILITVKDSVQDLTLGLEAGADDYVAKPFDPGELAARLKVGERVIGFAEGLLSANAMLKTMALTDDLTGLLNHGASITRLREEYSRHDRSGLPLSVIMADLDHFKKVNDQLGHDAGDEVLRGTAQVMRQACRPYDILGRFGGEEFIALLPATSSATGLAVAERLRQRVEKSPVQIRSQSVDVKVSLGIATVTKGSMAIGDKALLHAADAALYRAKKKGRNRVEMASQEDFLIME
jgi:two-component system cell cycle response regulator